MTDPREAATMLYRHMLDAHADRGDELDPARKRYLWAMAQALVTRMGFTVEHGVTAADFPDVDTIRPRGEIELAEESDWEQQPHGSRRPRREFVDVKAIRSRWFRV